MSPPSKVRSVAQTGLPDIAVTGAIPAEAVAALNAAVQPAALGSPANDADRVEKPIERMPNQASANPTPEFGSATALRRGVQLRHLGPVETPAVHRSIMSRAQATTPVSRTPKSAVPVYAPPDETVVVRPPSKGSARWRMAGETAKYALPGVVAAVGGLATGLREKLRGKPFWMSAADSYHRTMGNAFGGVQRSFYAAHRKVTTTQDVFMVRRHADGSVDINARIYLEGQPEHVTAIRQLERYIEAHLTVMDPQTPQQAKYRMNVEFVDAPDDHAFRVRIGDDEWSNSMTWNPFDDSVIDTKDTFMIAHEIMHRLGAPDEYYYSDHAANPARSLGDRVNAFLFYCIQPELPRDAEQGIMRYSHKKPLARHFEAILAAQ